MQLFHRFSPATTVVRHRPTETAIVDFPARTDIGVTFSSLKRQIDLQIDLSNRLVSAELSVRNHAG
jgi:hypothetical protein